MTDAEIRKLRTYFRSLRKMQTLLEGFGQKAYVVGADFITPLQQEITRIEQPFPDLVPPFPTDSLLYPDHMGEIYCKIPGAQAYLATVIARLESELDVSESTPVTENLEFTFIQNAALRQILERDWPEIQKCTIAGCWKSAIILSGGAIEAILADRLLQDASRAQQASKAPREQDITKWDLSDLIDVCIELEFVNPGIEKPSHSVRQYRNLVHPGNEIRNKLEVAREEATIAVEILKMIHRDLSK